MFKNTQLNKDNINFIDKKKIKKHSLRFLSLLVMLLICTSVFYSKKATVAAQEAFVINQFDVDIHSNPDYSFDITEKINVEFSEDRHGIFRAIPNKGGAQRYTISDINVEGDKFAIENDALNVIIRIGDANAFINGNKTYTISYKLNFNKDIDTTQDLVSLNLTGNLWDTQIKNSTVNFFYPSKTAKPNSYKVFTGVYGSKDETNAEITALDDRFVIKNKSAFSNFEGMSLLASFPDNTFNKAIELPEPYKLSEYKADIKVNKDKSINYKETFNLKISDISIPAYYYLPLSTQENEHLVIKNVRLNGTKLSVNDLQGVFPISITKEGENTLEYTIYHDTIDSTTNETLSIMLFSNYRETTMTSAKINIKSSFTAPDSYYLSVATLKNQAKFEETKNTQGESISIEIKQQLNTGEGIFIDLKYPIDSFGFVISFFTIIAILAGLLLLWLSIYWYQKHGKDDLVSPVIEFYPPEGLSSGAIGYVGDRVVHSIDISSMLIYWASHNHLHFVATDRDDFTISFISDLDESHPKWEQNAFAKLKDMIMDEGNLLTKDDLQKNFYKVSEKIKFAIPLFFKNDKALDDKKSSYISGLMCFISALWFGLFTGVVVNTGLESYLLALICGVASFAAASIYFGIIRSISNGWHKRSKPGNYSMVFFSSLFILFGSLIYIFLSFVIETTVQSPAILFTLGITIALQLIAVFTVKRSSYGQEMLERIIGFKEFLHVAEKERLEALLEENPQYYYQVLPFALVLGVSDIWANKFKNIQMSEPSWYQGNYPGYMFSYMALSSFARSTSTTLSHYTAPPQASGTGGFSGGGGGGFSGGGGGGGGGGSW